MSSTSNTMAGIALVTLSLARHMERSGAITEGSCLTELERRLERLPASMAGTETEDVFKLAIAWLRRDESQHGGEVPPLTIH